MLTSDQLQSALVSLELARDHLAGLAADFVAAGDDRAAVSTLLDAMLACEEVRQAVAARTRVRDLQAMVTAGSFRA